MSSRLLLIAKTTSNSRFYSSLFDLSGNTLRFTPFRMAWGSHNLRKSIRPSDQTTPLGHSPQAYFYNLLFDGAELYRHYSLRLSLIFFFFGLSPEFFFCHLLWFSHIRLHFLSYKPLNRLLAGLHSTITLSLHQDASSLLDYCSYTRPNTTHISYLLRNSTSYCQFTTMSVQNWLKPVSHGSVRLQLSLLAFRRCCLLANQSQYLRIGAC